MPHSVFISTGGGSGQKTRKRGSSERPSSGPRFDDHDRARSRELDDVFSSVLRRPNSAGAQVPAEDGILFKADLVPVDDGDPWVDTDSVGSESGADLAVHSEF